MELAGIIVAFVIVTGMIIVWLYDYFKDEEGEDEWLGLYSVVSYHSVWLIISTTRLISL